MPSPAFRDVEFPPVDLVIETHADGSIVMTPRESLQIENPSVPAGLARQASLQPDRPHLAERPADGDGWRKVSFAEIKAAADAVTQWLIDLDPEPGRPVMILSGNSINHAIMRYGAMGAGVPVCPVSENYALMGGVGGYERLRHVVDLVRPAVIFAEDGKACGPAIKSVAPKGSVIVTGAPCDLPSTLLDDVLASRPGEAVAARIAALDPDAPAAYMLTSGSTGRPKAVIQTQRMITANLYQGWQVLGRAAGWDDTLLEWLPWSHVSGAFSSMAAAIFGGTYYIDGGKPMPGRFDETIRNLREVPLKYFTNVPAGYAMLADALEEDEVLRRTFFQDLRLMLYGGAGLPQPLYDRIQALAISETGKRVFFTTGYGATETTSGCMSIYFMSEQVGIGLPMPGLSVKMVPAGDRYELRMKGPMITSGYLDQPELNATLRDEDDFYRIGDTARFHNPDKPEEGLAFAGRLAEEFKLDTGTWVSGGALRAEIVAALSPCIADAVICGENKPYIALLAWPNPKGLAELTGTSGLPLGELLQHPTVTEAIRSRLTAHNARSSGSSQRIGRFAFLTEPPNAEAHEVSDKGTINQSIAKQRRAADIEALYAAAPGPGIIDPLARPAAHKSSGDAS
ncbi:AMP-binding protein [Maricaulis sp.]|uniref:AMP-binding protein n=1 Tax=Maricaulis sp. TaxID=1486257 RepID=UPI003A93A2B4